MMKITVSELKYVTIEALKQGQAVVKLKGKIRVVIFTKELCKVLKRYAEERGINEGIIFITRTGKAVDRYSIWKSMKKLCETAGVNSKKVFPHNLRHLFARTFYGIQKDIVRLADILGASRGEMRIGSITNEIALLNNQIHDMVKEEIEKRSENEVIEEKCAELHGKIKVLKEEIKSIRTEKQMAEAGSGKLRDVYEALQSMNTEFTEFDDIAVRRLVSRVSILSEDKVIVTLCDSLDIEQQIQIGK